MARTKQTARKHCSLSVATVLLMMYQKGVPAVNALASLWPQKLPANVSHVPAGSRNPIVTSLGPSRSARYVAIKGKRTS